MTNNQGSSMGLKDQVAIITGVSHASNGITGAILSVQGMGI